MTLVVGLGNIGKEYENTRHNVGFMLADLLLFDGGFTDVSSAKFKGELFKKGSQLIAKPTTFMNASGLCVKPINDFYKPDHIIVIHDDLDIPFGSVRFKNGGSSGGHNGIKSIDSLIGNDYDRVRIGIGRTKGGVISYVLGEFTQEEKVVLKEILAHCKEAVLRLIQTNDIKQISSDFTRKPADFGL
ncbi:aminoacyl-tRNA hydrolase [Campylobacter hyointestinalis]|uniref:Peptidyl-tRNA hydrolase n=1 Tax=Campylobacter hyointestinalis subsp. hyointestinalis TaxID=91352 RepID=A0A9W5AVV3_CAMHY|nr:aminoacyl-tRNA hydrolase [Campylobacter hyointestinalis]CUU68787.1 peptidyl-tRNA hydrolase [Campylobacter hyointestinalis subsp. hyointestinalis]CUU87366.1 peptidyl-tRNA hydrolase [Campylobacter hyointestinalis subsp. hyointestinalis]